MGGVLQPSEITVTLADLIDHIVSVHHKYLELELPAVESLIAKSQGGSTLARIFPRFRRDLEMHLKKEEQILFPLMIDLEKTLARRESFRKLSYGSIANPIAMMEQEHDFSRRDLLTIRKLTNHYQAPDDANDAFRELCCKLIAVEDDLERHSRLEDDILFPRAIEIESACGAQHT